MLLLFSSVLVCLCLCLVFFLYLCLFLSVSSENHSFPCNSSVFVY